MSRNTDRGVGQRIADERKLAGWTQDRLAQEANVSVSLVRAVEQGRAPASSAFVSSAAKALRTSPAELLGQPYPRTTRDEIEVSSGIALIRSELAAYDIPPAGLQPRPIEVVAADVERMRTLRRASHLRQMSQDLPALMTEVRALVHSEQSGNRRRGYRLLCEMYLCARGLAHKLGYTDLMTVAIERLGWAAARTGSRLWVTSAQYFRASVLTSTGDWNTALMYLERCRSELESELGVGDIEHLVSWGGLHLQSGLAAARAGDRDTADAHLGEARETAARVGGADYHEPVFYFGPTNVGIWSVGLAVEMLDGTEAITRADGLPVPASTPKSRAGHLYIDLARGFLLHGDRAKTLDALNTARKIAPILTRYHPMVHETVRVLARQEARSTESLRGFAAWCGVGQ
ncbi:helix-turn-helix domain-containing protein [Nocardia sp. NBC_01329]|uniref:helix-turn-helix domain-containing protein n=1 Tax=Nocardia sp. NBC_01329 TaxID=2903594 RepID=UPI002E0F37BD|nr:helix-turn-helix domain-containing protein [Nocardia sp. NBC_01329]